MLTTATIKLTAKGGKKLEICFSDEHPTIFEFKIVNNRGVEREAVQLETEEAIRAFDFINTFGGKKK